MDVRCGKCGEPWELDTFHDVAKEQGVAFDEAMRQFRAQGCWSTGWTGCNPDTVAHPAIAELADLLGDDVDGFASLLEDFDLDYDE